MTQKRGKKEAHREAANPKGRRILTSLLSAHAKRPLVKESLPFAPRPPGYAPVVSRQKHWHTVKCVRTHRGSSSSKRENERGKLLGITTAFCALPSQFPVQQEKQRLPPERHTALPATLRALPTAVHQTARECTRRQRAVTITSVHLQNHNQKKQITKTYSRAVTSYTRTPRRPPGHREGSWLLRPQTRSAQAQLPRKAFFPSVARTPAFVSKANH